MHQSSSTQYTLFDLYNYYYTRTRTCVRILSLEYDVLMVERYLVVCNVKTQVQLCQVQSCVNTSMASIVHIKSGANKGSLIHFERNTFEAFVLQRPLPDIYEAPLFLTTTRVLLTRYSWGALLRGKYHPPCAAIASQWCEHSIIC